MQTHNPQNIAIDYRSVLAELVAGEKANYPLGTFDELLKNVRMAKAKEARPVG